jgi:hypothetical protein
MTKTMRAGLATIIAAGGRVDMGAHAHIPVGTRTILGLIRHGALRHVNDCGTQVDGVPSGVYEVAS